MNTTVVGEQAREALRREHGVRLVTPAEEGTAAEQLPAGVYGFTSSPVLASPLFATRRYRNFEIHRLEIAPAVIGYVTPAEAAALTSSDNSAVDVHLHPDAEGEATTLVAISYDRILHHRQYSIRNAGAVGLRVAPGLTQLSHA